jgi:hypothetical protein
MDVPLQPDKEAQLAQIAAQRGLRTDELADARFIEAVNSGLAAAAGQDFVEDEEVRVKVQRILRP